MDTIVIQWYINKWSGILKFSPIVCHVIEVDEELIELLKRESENKNTKKTEHRLAERIFLKVGEH